MVSIPDEKLPTALSNMESNIADPSAVWAVGLGAAALWNHKAREASSPGVQCAGLKAQQVSCFSEAPQMLGRLPRSTAVQRVLFRTRAGGSGTQRPSACPCARREAPVRRPAGPACRPPDGSHYSQN